MYVAKCLDVCAVNGLVGWLQRPSTMERKGKGERAILQCAFSPPLALSISLHTPLYVWLFCANWLKSYICIYYHFP